MVYADDERSEMFPCHNSQFIIRVFDVKSFSDTASLFFSTSEFQLCLPELYLNQVACITGLRLGENVASHELD